MKTEPLVAPLAKIEWAKAQIHKINEIIQAVTEGDFYEIVSRIDPTGQEEVYSFRLKAKVPGELTLLVGETLHNIRTPLDQMIAAVSIQHRGSAKGTCFPFGGHQNYFETGLAKQKKLLPADAIELIRATQPYKGGNLLLWALHELNRTDKHYDELVPILVNQGWAMSALAVEKGGMAYVMGDPRRQYLVVGDYVPLPRGSSIPGEVEFLTVKPGTRFHTVAKPTFSVAFGKIEGLEREPIVAVLYQMRDLVESILLTFKTRFFN